MCSTLSFASDFHIKDRSESDGEKLIFLAYTEGDKGSVFVYQLGSRVFFNYQWTGSEPVISFNVPASEVKLTSDNHPTTPTLSMVFQNNGFVYRIKTWSNPDNGIKYGSFFTTNSGAFPSLEVELNANISPANIMKNLTN